MNQTNIKDMASAGHDLWTAERIGRFWDLVANDPIQSQKYFSKYHTSQLVDLVRIVSSPGDLILDYGSGPGFLTKALVKAGLRTQAVEFSQQSCDVLNRELQGSGPNWLGCLHCSSPPIPVESGQYDVIVTIETYEHLREEWVSPYFAELNRLLKPGGKVILSTPAHESLTQNTILCPNCEITFHQWGHLRSVTEKDLSEKFRHAGFETVFCKGINMQELGRPYFPYVLDITPRAIIRKLKNWLYSARYQATGRKLGQHPTLLSLPPGYNLLCIVQKTA